MIVDIGIILFSILKLTLNFGASKNKHTYIFWGSMLVMNIIFLFEIRNVLTNIIVSVGLILLLFEIGRGFLKRNKS